ncbi:Gcd10p-domain-containing protein [Fistulina hepatica ATCC 64428]|uniref:tRNA (adenine(58)-N(1))-methyltransferase non-catalytic subunit TRM6 n=1 Tax=Fistulina hepatica ATCC 64428 TaxID=1128425 RepID=A0A0D7AH08_9AGAR|nr:Gcd10p-domain-containing protein [Fistulina hepatica ATCC 64428]
MTTENTAALGATVQAESIVLLRLPNDEVRAVKVEAESTVSIGRFGSFLADELIGQPYGLTYEISNKRLIVIPAKSFQEVDDTDATNELISDGQAAQPLTYEEIQALKESGAHASDIIKRQIEQHANYALKTEFSKEKYKKRKEAKYSKTFTTVQSTLFNVCEYWFKKDHDRIRDLRPDSLAQIVNMASIRPGGRYIVVDDASGMLVCAVLERLGGKGRLFTICDTESPPAYPVMNTMNFRLDDQSSVLVSLNWATADEDYTPLSFTAPDTPEGEAVTDRQRSRINKRKVVVQALVDAREELFAGEFEGLIIASQYEPYSIVEKLSPYLAGSAPIVIHSPYPEVLVETQNKMRMLSKYLAPTLTEAWLRQYQILPGRTHPFMNMSGSGGYILSAIFVYVMRSVVYICVHQVDSPIQLFAQL